MSIITKSLKYSKYGEPGEVIKIVEGLLQQPKANEVLVKVLAAPVNPADIYTIRGEYPIKPKFPAVGGMECVAEVVSIGEKVSKLTTGQHVIPFALGRGTWTTYSIYAEDQLTPISSKIGVAEAATLTVNPCTAYLMLKNFVNLKPGDCVIQNGANSAAGQAVHQLCRAWNIKSVGIVRDRPDIETLKKHLKSLGATEVLTEDEIRTSTLFKENKLPRPCLALDCVGGKSATELACHLANKGIMVTYGSMSREPVVASTAALIFKDISFKGFWLAPWSKENFDSPARTKMFAELCEMIEQGQLVGPVHEMVPLHKFKDALVATLDFKGFKGKKFILDLQSSSFKANL